MDLAGLLANPPTLHVDSRGRPVPWEASDWMLRLIDASVSDGARTLETGAGMSTLVFALNGCHHTCVVPFHEESERIGAWCTDNGVSTERLTFVVERSEDALPRLDLEPLDVVLIDGGHGFPTPFVDWQYAGRRLREGGVLIIDDTHLWTGAVLRGFLDAQPGWEPLERLPMRAAAFRRTRHDGPDEEFVHQPYVMKRSFHAGARGRVRQVVRAADVIRREGPRTLLARARRR